MKKIKLTVDQRLKIQALLLTFTLKCKVLEADHDRELKSIVKAATDHLEDIINSKDSVNLGEIVKEMIDVCVDMHGKKFAGKVKMSMSKELSERLKKGGLEMSKIDYKTKRKKK
jgi:hypothetical protein